MSAITKTSFDMNILSEIEEVASTCKVKVQKYIKNKPEINFPFESEKLIFEHEKVKKPSLFDFNAPKSFIEHFDILKINHDQFFKKQIKQITKAKPISIKRIDESSKNNSIYLSKKLPFNNNKNIINVNKQKDPIKKTKIDSKSMKNVLKNHKEKTINYLYCPIIHEYSYIKKVSILINYFY